MLADSHNILNSLKNHLCKSARVGLKAGSKQKSSPITGERIPEGSRRLRLPDFKTVGT